MSTLWNMRLTYPSPSFQALRVVWDPLVLLALQDRLAPRETVDRRARSASPESPASQAPREMRGRPALLPLCLARLVRREPKVTRDLKATVDLPELTAFLAELASQGSRASMVTRVGKDLLERTARTDVTVVMAKTARTPLEGEE